MTIKQILYTIALLLIGLLIGYVLFYTEAPSSETANRYSCAMHPAIEQGEPGICPLCNMELTVKETEIAQTGNAYQLQMSLEAVQLSNIQTSPVKAIGNADKIIPVDGEVMVDESRVAQQIGHLPGRIEELYVNTTGSYIRKGQKIASVYSKELVAVIEALNYSKTSESVLRSARNNLKNWRIDEALIKSIDVKKEYRKPMDIYADVEGLVLKKYVQVGDYLSAGHMGSPTAMYEVADLSSVWVVFDLFEKDISTVRIGQTVQFQIPALQNKSFSARVEYIDPVLNKATNSVKVRVRLANPLAKLKPGMQAIGHLRGRLSGQTNQLLIPKTAVLWTGDSSIVYVKNPQAKIPTFEYRPIVLGEDIGEQYVVKEGLAEGERVVTNGAFRVDAVAQLNNKASMLNDQIRIPSIRFAATEQLDKMATLNQEGQRMVKQLLEQYFALKAQLVASEPTSSQAIFVEMDQLLQKADTVQLPLLNSIFQQLATIVQQAQTQTDLEAQRKYFFDLSQQIAPLFAIHSTAVVYQQYCPMAFGGDGAHWFSQERQIANPYYGDKMLRCGVVQDSLVASK